MTELQTQPRTGSELCAGLRVFQKKVQRVVINLIVKDDGGRNLCELTAKSDLDASTVVQNLILGLVAQWAEHYNSAISDAQSAEYGYLMPARVEQMEAVMMSGTELFTLMQKFHGADVPGFSDAILDMRSALGSLDALISSYEINPTNDVLDGLFS